MQEIVQAWSEALQRNEAVALVTVVQVIQPSPAQLGWKLLVWPDGRTLGNIGGGELAQQARQQAIEAMQDGQPRMFQYHPSLTDPNQAACGGHVSCFIDVHQPAPTLLIVGGGHVGQPLAEMARIIGLHVQVVDIDPERSTVPRFDPAQVTPWTYVVISTRTHESDEETLRQALSTPAAYLGMVGSRRKVQTLFEHLRAEGVLDEQLNRVHSPIGLDLGGRSPAEIALAILAEIVQTRYHRPGLPMAPALSAHDGAGAVPES